MATRGDQYLLAAGLLIMAFVRALQANPIVNEHTALKYFGENIGKRILTSSQDNEEDATLFELQKRAGDNGLVGSSGTGIVPSDFSGSIRDANKGIMAHEKRQLTRQKSKSLEIATPLRRKNAFSEHRLSVLEGDLGENSDSGTEPEALHISRGLFSHHRDINSAAKIGGAAVDLGKTKDIMMGFHEYGEGRSENRGLEGNSGIGIVPSDQMRGLRDSKLHPRDSSDEGRFVENSGIGIDPDDTTENGLLFPLDRKGRSDEGLGGNGGIVIDPLPPFILGSELKHYRSLVSQEEGNGRDSGTGIGLNDRAEGRSDEGGHGSDSRAEIVKDDRRDDHLEEGLPGNSGIVIDPLPPLKLRIVPDDRAEGRSGEGDLGGENVTGIVPDRRAVGGFKKGFPGRESGTGIVYDGRAEGLPEGEGLGGNGGIVIDPLPTTETSDELRYYLSDRSEEGMGGNSGTGIIPDGRAEGLPEGEGLGGNGGIVIDPLPTTGTSDELRYHLSDRSEEGMGGNSGTGIIPDGRAEGQPEGDSLRGNGGIVIDPLPTTETSDDLRYYLSDRSEEGMEGNSGTGIIPDGRAEGLLKEKVWEEMVALL